MASSSLETIEEFVGEELTGEWAEELARLPVEQLAELLNRLYETYTGWTDQQPRAVETNAVPAIVGRNHDVSDSAGEYLDDVRRAALLLEQAVVPDPLDRDVWPITTAAVLTGYTPEGLEKFRPKLRQLLLVLDEIAPLVRQGAITLSPRGFAWDREEMQKIARLELGDEDPLALQPDGSYSTEPGDFAINSAFCSYFGYRPVALTPWMARRLSQGAADVVARLNVQQIEIETAFSKYSIPNMSRIPVKELAALYRDSEALAKCRATIGEAILDARDRVNNSELTGQKVFDHYFLDEINKASEDLKRELKGSASISTWVPETMAAACVGAVTLNTDAELIPFLANCAIPGTVWLISRWRHRLSKDTARLQRLSDFYGYLLVEGEG